MATERTTLLRRPARLRRAVPEPPPVKPKATKSKGKTGLVPPGTRGIYDDNPSVRSRVARAMVSQRRYVEVVCEAEGCFDPRFGGPVRFLSRIINGRPERRGCCQAHRLKIWRREMKDKGYRQATVNGRIGWVTPEGTFHPNPSQPKRRRDGSTARKTRKAAAAEVKPESG
jgi:hypothetical protein